MTIKEYIELLIIQSAKYRDMIVEDEINKIEQHFIKELGIPLTDNITEVYKKYIYGTFEYDYIHFYYDKGGVK